MGKRISDMGKARAGKPSVSAHPAFPAIVALWFSALLGIGFLVLPAPILEAVIGATGLPAIVPAAAPPLGLTARALLGGTAAIAGAVIGFLLARKVAGIQAASRQERGRQRAPQKRETQSPPQPLSVDDIDSDGIASEPAEDAPGDDAGVEPQDFGRAPVLPGRRRALAVNDESKPSEFLYTVPVPGEDAGDFSTSDMASERDAGEEFAPPAVHFAGENTADSEAEGKMSAADPIGAFARPRISPQAQPTTVVPDAEDPISQPLELGEFSAPQIFESEPEPMSEFDPTRDAIASLRNSAPAPTHVHAPLQSHSDAPGPFAAPEEAQAPASAIEPNDDFGTPADAPFAPPVDDVAERQTFMPEGHQSFAPEPEPEPKASLTDAAADPEADSHSAAPDFSTPTPTFADPLASVIEEEDDSDEDEDGEFEPEAPLTFAAPSLAAKREAEAKARAEAEAAEAARLAAEAEERARVEAEAEAEREEAAAAAATVSVAGDPASLSALVERLGSALSKAQPTRPAAQEGAPSAAEPTLSAPDANIDDGADVDLSSLDFSLPLHAVEAAHLQPAPARVAPETSQPTPVADDVAQEPVHSAPPAAMIPVSFEDEDDELDEVDEDLGYSSLLAMKNPFAGSGEPSVRIDLPDDEDEEPQPMVVFPHQERAAPAAPNHSPHAAAPAEEPEPDNTVPFARPEAEAAPRPKLDFEQSEQALRDALAKLQRNQGGR